MTEPVIHRDPSGAENLHVLVSRELYERRAEFVYQPVTVTMTEPDETGQVEMVFRTLHELPFDANEITVVNVGYTNHRGEQGVRRVLPRRVWFGSTTYHREPQFLLDVWDLDKGAPRTYALSECDFAHWR